jgi:acid phosphatase (class A)
MKSERFLHMALFNRFYPCVALALVLAVLGCGSPSESRKKTETVSAALEKSKGETPPWAIPYYFKDFPRSIESLIPAPPVEGSPEDLKDRESLLQVQEKRTAAQCASAASQVIPSLEAVFMLQGGDQRLPDFKKLSPKTMTAIREVYDRVQRDTAAVGLKAKRKFARKRPYERWKEIEPCIARESSPAYPSGHSWYAAAGGEILADLFPRKRKGIKAVVDESARHRLVGGVHHPSDIEAGKALGRKVYAALKENTEFRVDLRKAKKALQAEENRKVQKKFAPGSSLEKVPAGGPGL